VGACGRAPGTPIQLVDIRRQGGSWTKQTALSLLTWIIYQGGWDSRKSPVKTVSFLGRKNFANHESFSIGVDDLFKFH
jgi:hypothetical protein